MAARHICIGGSIGRGPVRLTECSDGADAEPNSSTAGSMCGDCERITTTAFHS